MRPLAVLLVPLAAALASCAVRPATYSGWGDRTAASPNARAAAHSNEGAVSSTEIGPENPGLARGARAFEAGHVADGMSLTLEGLKHPSPRHDLAAGHANLCAGYVLMGRYDDALQECNLSIRLDPNNWRAYNNRAAAFSAQGLYEIAEQDIETGLKIAPNCAVLLKSLAIIHRDEQLLREQQRRFAADA